MHKNSGGLVVVPALVSSDSRSIKADNAGNVYVAGIFSGTISFDSASDPKSLVSAGSRDLFLIKVNCAADAVWCNRVGGTGNEGGAFNYLAVSIAPNSDVYFTGTFSGTATFTSQNGSNITKTSTGGTDIFLAKYDSLGNIIWVINSGSTLDDEGTGVYVNDKSEVISTGLYRGTTTFKTTSGGTINKTSVSGADAFVAKYTEAGVLQWVSVAGGPGDDIINKVITDKHQNVYAMGNVTCCVGGTITYGSKTFYNGSSWGGAIAKADSNGVWQWVNGMGTNAIEGLANAIIDDSSNVYVFGHFSGASRFTSSPPGLFINLTPIGLFDVELCKMDSNGILKWAKVYGGTGDDFAWEMKFYNNNILIAGKCSGTANFNGVSITTYGSADAFVVEVDRDGNGLSATKMGGTGTDECFALDIDNAGGIYAAGYYNSNAMFNPFVLGNTGGNTSFYAKIEPTTQFLIDYTPTLSICFGDSTFLFPKKAQNNVSYQWLRNGVALPGETKDTLVVKSAGSYRLTYSNSCNERDTSQIIIVTSHFVNVNAGVDTTLCKGDSIMLLGSGAFIYDWSPSLGLSSTTVANPYCKPSDTIVYILKGVSGACISYDTIQVNVFDFSVNAGIDTSICKGDSVRLVGSGANTYQWKPFSTLDNPLVSNPYAKPTDTTQYILNGYIRGCLRKDTVQVNVKKVTVDAGSNQVMCLGDSVQLQGNATGTYQWSPPIGLSDISILNPYAKPAVNTTYYLSTTQNGCSDFDSMQVVLTIGNFVNAGSDTSICFGDSVQLNASGGFVYNWFPNYAINDVNIANPKVSPAIDTSYIVKNTAGCVAYDTVHVVVNSLPIVEAGNDLTICLGDKKLASATVTGADTYLWSPPVDLDDPTLLNPQFTSRFIQRYTLTATNSITNCSSKDSMLVIPDSVIALFQVDQTSGIVPFTVHFTNKSTNGNSYLWNFDSSGFNNAEVNPSFIYTKEGKFYPKLKAFSANGCVDSFWLAVDALGGQIIYIPNVFTPNGNGNNDEFVISIYNLQILKKLHGTIWNRWGAKIYDFSYPNGHWWDGTFNGVLCQEGVYVYIVEVEDIYGHVKKYSGNVTLMR